jgi:hypothetical protein
MPLRPCLGVAGHSCHRLTSRTDSRCPTCASAWHQRRDAARGNRHQRGYGTEHDDIRADLLTRLVPGALCPRCSQPMWPHQELHAGHPIGVPLRRDRTSRADHLEHAACNEGAND